MNPNLTLALLAGALVGCGVVLLLSRSLVRALLGVLLMGNGVNIVFLIASGAPGRAPIVAKADAPGVTIGADGVSDPLPQAMVLTAIVITLAVTGFVLSLVHRQWQLASTDDLSDDPEDARIQALAEANDISGSDYTNTADPHALADDAEDTTEGTTEDTTEAAASSEQTKDTPDAEAAEATHETGGERR